VKATRQALIAELGTAMQAYQRSNAAFDDEVGKLLGLNPTDLRCLDWLSGGRMSAGDLSSAIGLSPAATTALIDRLERRGFVRRVRGDTDRRQVLVEMTEEGARQSWDLYGPLVDEGAGLFKRFNTDQLATMIGLLEALRDLVDEHCARLRRSQA
jgi:DNA-binding MarR family transcriptional regulator